MTLADATIIDACRSPSLFARWFKRPETWHTWFVFLRTMFGLALSADDLEVYRRCTGRADPPEGAFREAFLVIGRRGGKSIILALIAVFLAAFHDWSRYIVPGERAVVLVIATDKRQARVIFRYIRAMLTVVAVLKPLVERVDAEAIELTTGVSVEISTASFRSVRGYTVLAALVDEAAYLRDEESATPDVELLNALRPAMATIPDSRLLVASSPYAKRGILYAAFRAHFGKASSVLVWRADTLTMNPTVPRAVIDEAYDRDPVAAASEYGKDGAIEFRSDIESFAAREVVEALVVAGRFEVPPAAGVQYVGFVDPSGGSSDSMTLAVAHRDRDGRAILDALRERRPPFSPEAVVSEFCDLLKTYRLSKVTGDRYAGEWPRERFRAHGVAYDLSEAPKSDIYQALLPIINSGKAELLDSARLAAQLCSLERRTARSGKDSIDHAPGAHDDLANAAAGALVLAASKFAPTRIDSKTVAALRIRDAERMATVDGAAPSRGLGAASSHPFARRYAATRAADLGAAAPTGGNGLLAQLRAMDAKRVRDS